MLNWADKNHAKSIIGFDIDPKNENTIKQDTLTNPPDYGKDFILTNPPYLYSGKSRDKTIFDLWNCDDSYKCFLYGLVYTNGNATFENMLVKREQLPFEGIIIIPLNFLSSDLLIHSKSAFLRLNLSF